MLKALAEVGVDLIHRSPQKLTNDLGEWPTIVVTVGCGHECPSGQAVHRLVTCPSVEQACQAFTTAGFRRDALEQVPETLISLAEFLDQAHNFRRADTNMHSLTDEEFLRGKEQLRRAVQHAEESARTETRTSWLDLLVLR